jgi:D-3-phosphoglycerate dehydrogenase
MKIAVLDDYLGYSARFADWGALAEKVVVFTEPIPMDRLAETLAPFDVLCVMRERTPLPGALIAALPNLRLIVTTGMRNGSIDMAAATARGITVCGTASRTTATSHLAMTLILAATRNLLPNVTALARGGWQAEAGRDLDGLTLGLIGLGRLGAEVAALARPFGMRIVAWSANLDDARCAEVGAERMESLTALLRVADVASIHLVLSDRTRGLIGAEALAKCKAGVRIINCARGGIVDEQALADALDSGHVAGAAFDVFVDEPARENLLFGRANVVCTPHLGAATEEAQENVAVQVAEQMADYLLTGAITNALNMPSISAEDAPRLKPYMKLACQLGSFAGQVTETGLKSVTIEFEGAVAKLNHKPLVQAALAELMKPFSDTVNMVNAPIFARDRGIDVSETVHERPGNYNTLIRLTVETERFTRSIAGTLFGGDMPRLVSIKDIAIEAELTDHMLYITNKDQPGLIGGLGTILGDAGINVATFHLGRHSVGGDAIALIATDGAVEGAVLDKIKALPQVLQAKPLRF